MIHMLYTVQWVRLAFISNHRIWCVLAKSMTSKQANISVCKEGIILWPSPQVLYTSTVWFFQLCPLEGRACLIPFWFYVWLMIWPTKAGKTIRLQVNLNFRSCPASLTAMKLSVPPVFPVESILSCLEVCMLQTCENWARINWAAHSWS